MDNNTSSGWLWFGGLMLVGLFFFKWLPGWLWKPVTPEIKVNNYIFETHPKWVGNEATVSEDSFSDLYFRVEPKDAVDERAELVLNVNGMTVEDNCSYGSADYFCYRINKQEVSAGKQYEVVAKNKAGEARAVVRIVKSEAVKDVKSEGGVEKSEAETKKNESESAPGGSPAHSSGASSSSEMSGKSSVLSCSHYEHGRCWDELESEAYSAGLYDHENGYYGRQYAPDDDCDDVCEDILIDAYEEGWYDSY